MKNNEFPFLPMPLEIAKKVSRYFDFFSNFLLRLNKKLKQDLVQADMDIKPRTYASVSLLSVFILFISSFVIVSVIGFYARGIQAIPTAAGLSFLAALVTLFYYMSYPKIVIIKRKKRIDRDLIFALRYILIRIRSGIPLYDAMVSVAQQDYGLVSTEFRKTIKEISAGENEIKALENMAVRNPSEFFRRIIWQIANNMRSGTDISDILENITKNLVDEHKILIRKYGSELNPVILMYMMFSIVIPSLSITVLVVMSSFSGVQTPVWLFYAIPAAVFMLQIFFISIIKNKKPALVI